jgi:transcriptional regulator
VLKQKTNVLQGTLDMLVLKTLSWGAQHGYGIALRIQTLSNEVLKVEEGSLYPALYRLEEQGWIDSEWRSSENNRRAKYYRLTAKGRRYLRAEADAWDRLSAAVSKVMKAAEA